MLQFPAPNGVTVKAEVGPSPVKGEAETIESHPAKAKVNSPE
jgi:hypothetical protein